MSKMTALAKTEKFLKENLEHLSCTTSAIAYVRHFKWINVVGWVIVSKHVSKWVG